MLWLVIGVVTAAVLALLLLPLLRTGRDAAERRAYDLAVYRDQLREVERDVERGLVTEAEAEAVRTEVQRRMLAVHGRKGAEPPAAHAKHPSGADRLALAAVAVVVPAGALGLYLHLGSPDTPGHPFAERAPAPAVAAGSTPPMGDMDQAVAGLTARLERQPDDMDGWILLARSYMNLGRMADAVDAFRRAMVLSNHRTDVAGNYAEALVISEGNTVTAEARSIFEAIRAADPQDPKARFYIGLGKTQQGDVAGALQDWVDLERLSPADAPWLASVRRQITLAAEHLGVTAESVTPSTETVRLAESRPAPGGEPGLIGAPAPRPTAADMEAAARMSADDRMAMIRGMVERLADRLEENPDDLEGWLRLARSYQVLGDTERAADAMRRAQALRGVVPGAPAAPGPSPADIEAAADMSAEDRTAMIRGMVERLALRLETNADDLEGWLRLARSYRVLGDMEKAEDAMGRARALQE